MCQSALRNPQMILEKFCSLVKNQLSSLLFCCTYKDDSSYFRGNKEKSTATFEREVTSKCEILSRWLSVLIAR